MTITEAISLEHATLVRVFAEVDGVLPRLKSAADVGAMAAVLEGLLRSHAQREVEVAFVALDHVLFHKGHLTNLHQDHQELDERLRQVDKAANCEEARRLLRAAMRASRVHFRREERSLFPAMERALGLGVLTALGETYKKRARGAKTTGAE